MRTPTKTPSKKTWLIFFVVAFLSVLVWTYFTYPQLHFVDLSVDRSRARKIARDYLRETLKVNPDRYTHAIVFVQDTGADRFLQKALEFSGEMEFLKKHDFELFFWKNRFFRENEKEEYTITLSAATGEVTDFSHTIEETAARRFIDEAEAKKKVIAFLKERFGFNPDLYIPEKSASHKFDNRTNYAFTWIKDIPPLTWSPEPDSGHGKLLIGATVSGDEILRFYKNGLRIPDEYNRYLARQRNVGANLGVMFRILFFALLTCAVFFVIVRRNSLVMQTVKKFYIALTFVLFTLHLLAHLNHFDGILMNYRTTIPFSSYFWQYLMTLIMDIFIVVIGLLMPALAGEALRHETLPDNPQGGFLHYRRSTFLSRGMFRAVLLGYLVALMMFGLQSLAFAFGQKFLGVWVQYTWMSHLPESYFPFLTALTIGLSAGIAEEVTFRMFSISLGRKFFKNIVVLVLIASVIWGYGHSSYPVFPMWFRGLEVSLLGILLAWIYLKYGIVPVIVAHYLFDVFWVSSSYLLGQSTPGLFLSCLATLLIPLAFGLAAAWVNRPEDERPLRWLLNKHQQFNLNVLRSFLAGNPGLREKSGGALKKEIISHGWDTAVVEIALDDIKGTGHDQTM